MPAPRTLPIQLEVEATAAGPIMLALKQMDGVITMQLLLDDAPVRKKFAARLTTPPQQAAQPPKRLSKTATVLALLLKNGPMIVKDIQAQMGLDHTQGVYTVLGNLKNRGAVESTGNKAEWRLTAKVLEEMQLPLAHSAVTHSGNGHSNH